MDSSQAANSVWASVGWKEMEGKAVLGRYKWSTTLKVDKSVKQSLPSYTQLHSMPLSKGLRKLRISGRRHTSPPETSK